MELPMLKSTNALSPLRQLSEKQLDVLLKRFSYSTVCAFTYEEASEAITKILFELTFRREEDDMFWEFSDGLPNY